MAHGIYLCVYVLNSRGVFGSVLHVLCNIKYYSNENNKRVIPQEMRVNDKQMIGIPQTK